MLRKTLIITGLLLAPSIAFAITVPWDRPASGTINPLYILDTVKANIFTATSTTQASTLPYASTTAISASGLTSGRCVQTSTGGLLTVTGAACATGSVTQINTTAPIQGGPITTTGTISITQSNASTDGYLSSTDWTTFNNKLSTTTYNLLRDWQIVNGALSPTTTLGIGVFASSTIGAGGQTTGLTISGGATTTGIAYFASNVGIGTSSPASILSVVSGANNLNFGTFSSTFIGITPAPAALSTANYVLATNGVDSSSGLTLLNNQSGDVVLRTGNIDRLRVVNSGEVGIASTTPFAKLAVEQTAIGTRGLLVQGFANNTTPIMEIRSGTSPNTDLFSILDSTGAGWLTVDNVGDVGIASSSPYAKFSVTNTGTNPSFIVEDSASPDATPFVIRASGPVGIGTSTPQHKLTVNGYISTEVVDWNLDLDLAPVDQVSSFCEYRSNFYAFTGGALGEAQSYKLDGNYWSLNNTFDIAVYETANACAVMDGYLYTVTGESAGDADMFRYDGTTWSLFFDFGAGYNSAVAMAVWNGNLYVGLGSGTADGDVYQCTASTCTLWWDNGTLDAIEAILAWNGCLYIATGNDAGEGDVYRSCDGTTPVVVFEPGASIEQANALEEYNGYLYVGLSGATAATLGDIYRTSNGTTWTLFFNGPNDDVDSLKTYNAILLAGMGASAANADIYACDGTTCTLVIDLGAGYNNVFSLGVFNGKSFAGTGLGAADADIYSYYERNENQLTQWLQPYWIPWQEQKQFPVQDWAFGANVGIGSTTPWGELSITNIGTGPTFLAEDSASPDTSPFIIDSSGNVGIGTVAPTDKIDVTGGFIDVAATTGGYQIDDVTIVYASSTTQSLQIGRLAGNTTNVNATNNTLVGYSACNGITSGANNVVIGNWSTGANCNITTGSNNIIIGYNIGVPSATAIQQMSIGNIIFGTGVDGVGGGISTGKIGIATSTPWAKLSVNADNLGTTAAFAVGSSTRNLFTVSNMGAISVNSASPNAIVGNATLVTGTVTVTTSAATANSYIILTRKTSGGTIGTAITYTTTAGSFTITSDSVLDTSTFTWFVLN